MVEEKVIIVNDEGLHARPAARYLQEAIKYQCDITLIKDNVEYDGKSILSILSMGAFKGSEITIRCNGDDEKAALENLKDFIENELH
ncbi:HPr family phosphocarrier protein [Miniphocaeibacter halophilus]|uniref:HPr family phosphocarrier protein n=1 Tax=Miniphocaeibacter halophilus TaxID=2931922 RepID=A0AC61MR06_9FIRM|nr:HPr family phosphocarrier protein [Miniphocaeibacter halophilus]QQK07394.1 HPr family phosphocarrier protein [Miniphocaeibacter halophilus]